MQKAERFLTIQEVDSSFNQQPDFDIINLHNLHNNYFDLRQLPILSKKYPTIITPHDSWLSTGHCAHPIDCPRWEFGCGLCPDLTLYPPIPKNSTAQNWLTKKEIFSKSKIFLITPSRWLLEHYKKSFIWNSVLHHTVIHNGVDQTVFTIKDKQELKIKIGFTTQFKSHHFLRSRSPGKSI